MKTAKEFPIALPTTVLLLCILFGSTSLSIADYPHNQQRSGEKPDTTGDVELLVTTANKSMLLQKSYVHPNASPESKAANTITLDPARRYQQIDGFGAAITGSTCYNLLRMTAEKRAAFLTEVFEPTMGYGYSYVRISIGASDFSLAEYTCCDEPGITNFRLHEYDRRDLLPILRQILAINPKVKIMASPWTCPRWMKVNNLSARKAYNKWTSGQLNPDCYQDYATYFVKFIREMEKEGIPIESVTIQNEPLNRGNSVSLYMTWQEQAEFIRSALGPAFAAAGIKTKIVVFDHNYNYDNIAGQKDYPVNIYGIPDAAKYIDGAAFHAYGGDKSELLKVHQAAPDKNLYFTETSIGSWNYSFDGDLMWSMRELGIGTLNLFNKAVIVWNLLLDEKGAPNRPGGCTTCYGAVEISSADYSSLDRKSHFYVIAHLAHTFSAGSTRIGTSGYQADGLYVTAAENPDGTYGVVLLNDTDTAIPLVLEDSGSSFPLTLPPKGITSCRWKK